MAAVECGRAREMAAGTQGALASAQSGRVGVAIFSLPADCTDIGACDRVGKRLEKAVE